MAPGYVVGAADRPLPYPALVTLDAPLVAAAAIHRTRGLDHASCSADEQTYQLQLAHVLLDGGYDGVATLEEALAGGDHGLGTVDRLDGELVVVDGEPWRVDALGNADLLPMDTRTPFVVVSSMPSPTKMTLRDCTREQVQAAIEDLVADPGAIVSVRLEGSFDQVLVRSVPAQEPPYRPYAEVCATDEVRWEHKPFFGVFVGFRFPDLEPGATLPGLHLHGLDRLRTTGGHNYELHVREATLSVETSHEVSLHLPERNMLDMLQAPAEMRSAQRALLRAGSLTIEQLATALKISPDAARDRVDWLADRGFVEETVQPHGEPTWSMTLTAPGLKSSSTIDDILDRL